MTTLTPPPGSTLSTAGAAAIVAGEAALIPLLRTQIDAIDAGIARLVAERARLSARVQSARIASGGVRVELGRERTVLAGYRDTLGDDGVPLGSAVLRLCRGPL